MSKHSKQHKIYLAAIENFSKRFNEIYSEKLVNHTMYYNALNTRLRAFDSLEILEKFKDYFYLTKEALEADIRERQINADQYIHHIEVCQKEFYRKSDEFQLIPISLRKLMGLDTRNLVSKRQFDILTNEDEKYEKNLTTTSLYHEIEQSQFDYYEILEEIRNYFINSTEEFEKYCLSEYGEVYDNKSRYLHEHVDSRVNEISLNFKDTILYLKKAGVLEKFKDRLLDYFKWNKPIATIKNTSLDNDIAMNTYPNKVINYVFNLNDSMDKITDDIEKLKNKFLKEDLLDIDLLHKKDQLNIKHESQIVSNRATMHNMKTKLFIFDAKVLGFPNSYIVENLATACEYDSKWINQNIKDSTIKKFYNEVLDLIKDDNLIEKATGIDIGSEIND